MRTSDPVFRLLVVEDDIERINCFEEWMPKDIKVTIAKSAGQAMGVLRLDCGSIYGGILLDYDLQEQSRTEADQYLSGGNVVEVLIKSVSPHVPILVHSVNYSGASRMTTKLEAAGFYVTRIPYGVLTKKRFLEWLLESQDIMG